MHRDPAVRRASVLAGVVFAALLALIVLVPASSELSSHPMVFRALGVLHRLGAPDWVSFNFIEFGANIALFVPVGAIVVLLAGARRWWLGVLVGGCASVAIETAQLIFVTSRVASLRDVVANTAGSMIGAVLAAVILAVLGARRARAARRRVTRS
ncbi:VanZ family protein [Planctomonas deserti]|uniref:VanZ family protein n=1 Tax=Planctomonas deserti TaxID=2144185 RepID=UPI000D3BDEDD|nr:VanZ family protein [Planctomonas deserti]